MLQKLLAMFALSGLTACGGTTTPEAPSRLAGSIAQQGKRNTLTFSIKNSRLYDHTGHEFVIRGVNNPHNYYPSQAYEALGRIRELGFNTVRIVWCAETLVRSGRCDPKDIHPLAELERILERLRSLELVALLNLQNATGSNDPGDLARLVDWYLEPGVKELLNRYQDMLLLNIANEWHGEWHDPQMTYLRSYQQQIARLRRGGLAHVLVVDARGWGQQFSSIPENYQALLQVDQNLLFSTHMFDQFGSSEKVASDLATIRALKIPFLIGEFACSHYPGQTVACETIMEEAGRPDYALGYLAWSFSGNGSPLEGLDLVSSKDWRTPTAYGQRVLYHPRGIQATSRKACIFAGADCDRH